MITVLYQMPLTGGEDPSLQLAEATNVLLDANGTLLPTGLAIFSDVTVINGTNIERTVDFTEASAQYQDFTIGPSETPQKRDAKRIAVITHMFDGYLSKAMRRRVTEAVTLGVYPT